MDPFEHLFNKQIFSGPSAIELFVKSKTGDSIDEMKEVIFQHLIINYFIDKLITEILSDSNHFDLDRINFISKVHMLPFKSIQHGDKIFNALKNLNLIRNKFAHNLDFRITKERIDDIYIFLNSYSMNSEGESSQIDQLQPIQAIKFFVLVACYFISENRKFFDEFINKQINPPF